MPTTKVFPPLDHLSDVPGYSQAQGTGDKLNALSEYESREVAEFVAAHPEYHPSPFNFALVGSWMALYDAVLSRWNLEICYADLIADGLLESATAPAAPEAAPGNPSITRVRSDALLEYRAPETEKSALAALRDDTNLSDHQRKARDRALALLAGQQRRALAPQNLYRD